MKPAAIMTPEAIAEAVAEYRHYSRIAEEAAAILDTLKDTLKAHMDAADVDTVTGPDFKITWKPVNGTKLDRAGIDAAFPGLLDRYTLPNPSRRFTVK
jgi:Phage-related protein, predicted endonuclease